jgi:outer membrane biosynthesis protein TonB
MKTLAAIAPILATVGALAAPASAQKSRAPHAAATDKKPEGFSIPVRAGGLGDAFDIGPRRVALPVGDEPAFARRAHGLSDGQVETVLKAHLADVEHCWNKQPASQRKTDTTAVLRLSVDAAGKVSSVEVAGELPAGAPRCISAAVTRWTFPAMEIASQVETAVALRAL